jgi:hypothetical protein
MRRSYLVMPAILFGLGGLAVAACGSSSNGQPSPSSDAGDLLDAEQESDTGSDAGSDAIRGPCVPTPFDAGTFAFIPPNAPRSSCASSQVLAYYDACFAGSSTTTACDAFTGDAANASCIGCVLTPQSASSYGAIVGLSNNTIRPNIEGCIALTDGNTSASGCGALYQALEVCRYDACAPVCDVSTPAGKQALQQCFSKSIQMLCTSEFVGSMCASRNTYSGCFFPDTQSYFLGYAALFCEAGQSDGGPG